MYDIVLFAERMRSIAKFFRDKINFNPSLDAASPGDDDMIAHTVGGKAVIAVAGGIAGRLAV